MMELVLEERAGAITLLTVTAYGVRERGVQREIEQGLRSAPPPSSGSVHSMSSSTTRASPRRISWIPGTRRRRPGTGCFASI